MANNQTEKIPSSVGSRLSIHYIAYIAEVALGEIPGLPPGCGLLLSICTTLLCERWYPGLATHHRPLLEQYMRFLTVVRTQEEYEKLRRVIQFCRCASGPPILRDAHPALHDPADRLQQVGFGLGEVIDAIYKLIVTKSCSQVDISKLHLTARRKRRARVGFPSSPHDLAPFGLKPAIQALIDWACREHSFKVATPVSHVLSIYLEAFQVDAIPSFIAVAPQFMAWMQDVLTQFVEIVANYGRGINTLDYFCSLLSRLGAFIVLFGQHTSWYCFDTHLFASFDPIKMVGKCNVVVLSCDLETIRKMSPHSTLEDETLKAMLNDMLEGFTRLAMWMIRLNPEVMSDVDLCSDITSNAKRHLNAVLVDPHRKIVGAILSLRYSGRCTAPNCTLTQVSEGQRLKLCAGCGVNLFCSYECQRHAWRHELAPHRAICITLKATNRCLGIHRDDPRSALKTIAATIPAEIVYSCVENLNTLKNMKEAVFCA
jgi:hypothetical protein